MSIENCSDAASSTPAEAPSVLPDSRLIYDEVKRLSGAYPMRVDADGIADVLDAIRALQGKPEAAKGGN